MKEFQDKVKEFNEARDWGKNRVSEYASIKDFLLNMCEEVGEAWSIIKWVNDPETLKKVIEENKHEFEDFVGDQLYLILKIAYLLDIDSEVALTDTLNEYEKRFPIDEAKKCRHGNKLAGGIDYKDKVQR